MVHVLDIDEMDVTDEVVVTPESKPVSEEPIYGPYSNNRLIKNINVVYEEVIDVTAEVART